MKVDIDKFKVEAGDVIFYKFKNQGTGRDVLRAFQERHEKVGMKGVMIVIMPVTDSIEVFNEEQMNHIGWYRKK